jgi:hypothetical protein
MDTQLMKNAAEQTLDQLAHAAFTAAVLAGPALFPHPATFAFAGFGIMFLREYTEEETAAIHYINFRWSKVFSPRSVLDMLGGAAGGFLIGLFA